MRDSKSTKTRIFVGNKTITLSIEKTDENISTEQRAKSVIKECLEHGQFRATELYNIIGIQLKLCSEKMCYKYLRELEGIGDIIKTEHNKSKVYYSLPSWQEKEKRFNDRANQGCDGILQRLEMFPKLELKKPEEMAAFLWGVFIQITDLNTHTILVHEHTDATNSEAIDDILKNRISHLTKEFSKTINTIDSKLRDKTIAHMVYHFQKDEIKHLQFITFIDQKFDEQLMLSGKISREQYDFNCEQRKLAVDENFQAPKSQFTVK